VIISFHYVLRGRRHHSSPHKKYDVATLGAERPYGFCVGSDFQRYKPVDITNGDFSRTLITCYGGF
jgi:hypothetical protein